MVSKNEVFLVDKYKRLFGDQRASSIESVVINHVTDSTVTFSRYDFLDNFESGYAETVSDLTFSQMIVQKIGRVEGKRYWFWNFRRFVEDVK